MANETTEKEFLTFGINPFDGQAGVRVLHPNVLSRSRFSTDEKPEYGAAFLFAADHPDLAAISKKCKELAKEHFPGKKLYTDVHIPIANGDKAADAAQEAGKNQDYLRGYFKVQTRTQFPPTVVDGRTPNMAVTQDESLFYSGAYYAAQIEFSVYPAVGNNKPGIKLYLQQIAFVAHGDRIQTGGRSPVEAFRGLSGAETTEDPTAGIEDDEDQLP